MINRLQLIRNIGQFDSVGSAASIPLRRLTLVFSENGRGKTTLAAVLRSLATGDPVPISERRRLAAQHPPHVILECQGGPPPAIFASNVWNRTVPGLVVFDDVFIDQNVHSGLAVHAHHRQNLHELILGARAVDLNGRVQDLVGRIEEHNRELRAREAEIPGADRGPFSVDEFCSLSPRADIDEAIAEAERSLAAAQDQDSVRRAPGFDSLRLPDLDLDAVDDVLGRDLPAIDAEALHDLQTHFARLGEGAESWVSEGNRRGLSRASDLQAACPFCAQDLGGSTIVNHYRSYFSGSYEALKTAIAGALQNLRDVESHNLPAALERAVRVIGERRQFWMRFCEVEEVAIETASIARDWAAAMQALVVQLGSKQAAPLERMGVSDETRALVARYRVHRQAIDEANIRLERGNQSIAVAKERAATADPAVLERDLARLWATKRRDEPRMSRECVLYRAEVVAKQATEQERDQAKTALEQYRSQVFPGYQTTINQYLARFNSGFRLGSMAYANTRGGPTCTYNVLVNNTPVSVGGVEAAGTPSFRTALSAGDRNTLALAFFFASLDQDPDLPNKCIVIDDPISSLDEHRTLTTVQEIRRLANRAGQVIVLSHNKPFMCRLWEGTDPTIRGAIEVVRDGSGSTLRAWDVSRDAVTEHDRRDEKLRGFLQTGAGDLLDVARSIRPHIEAFLRVACPAEFPPATLLGSFRHRCRQRLGTPDQLLDEIALRELEDIVEFANMFHHDTNPAWETEIVNDQALRGYVERAMRFVGL